MSIVILMKMRYWLLMLLKLVNNFFWSKLYLLGFIIICKNVLILLKKVFKIMLIINNKNKLDWFLCNRKYDKLVFKNIIKKMFIKNELRFIWFNVCVFFKRKNNIVCIKIYKEFIFKMFGVRKWFCVIVWKLIVEKVVVILIKIKVNNFLFCNVKVKD